MKDLLIRTTNISLEFASGDQNTVAVKNASISIPKGIFTIIYGASGSGKSSLLNVISGLQAPSKGQLFFNNQNLYEKTANELAYFRAEQLGIVYQTNYWVKSLSVLENVSMPLYFLGYSKANANELALRALRKVNMQSYAKKFPTLLSGGEQQRVAMARAIVSDPPVIIADEPTGNLDSKNGDMVMNLLKTLNKEQGKTIVLVTHNMEYLSIAQHLLEIQDGEVTEIKQEEIANTVKLMVGRMRKRIESLMESDR
jgi:putative ABC transport system ATP-binding protein